MIILKSIKFKEVNKVITTVEEVMERYKKELRRYKKWLNQFPPEVKESAKNAMGMMNKDDWQKIQEWNANFKAIERVLGLSKKEVKEIKSEIFGL